MGQVLKRLFRVLPEATRGRFYPIINRFRNLVVQIVLAVDHAYLRFVLPSRVGRPAVPVFWSTNNLGDDLNGEMLGNMLNVQPLRCPPRFSPKVLAIGSTLEFVRPGDRVIGTGLIRDETVDARGAAIYAVRGPLTQARVLNCDVPDTFGDLALLLPSVYTPRQIDGIEIAIVPHYVDKSRMAMRDPLVRVVDVQSRDLKKQIDVIASASIVVSSSLHGIIIAEAYGVRSVWVEASHDVIGNGFKFRDYYGATDRHAAPQKWDERLRFLNHVDAKRPCINTQALQTALASLKADLKSEYGEVPKIFARFDIGRR